MNRYLLTVAVAAALLESSARAQYATPAQDEAALESAAASQLSALGQYNYSLAAANRQQEEARGAALENNSRALREWYARKQLHADYVGGKNIRNPGLLDRLAELKRPDRLTTAQYSREGRQLQWPAILQAPLFDEERNALDRLFAQRGAFDAGTDSEFYRLTAKLCGQMHAKMVDVIDQLSSTDSVAARKFLKSLEFEARILPGDLGGLVNTNTAPSRQPDVNPVPNSNPNQ